MERFNESIALFDNNDPRTFDDIYGDKMDLFEDNNDVIDPRMIKLFEATYKTVKLTEEDEKETEEDKKSQLDLFDKPDSQLELFEKIHLFCKNKLKEQIPPGGHNFTGDEPAPSGDGVPASHNKPGLSGSDPATVQSNQDYSRNPKFFESVYKKSYIKNMKKTEDKLKESIGDRHPIDPDEEIECEECGESATHWLDYSGGVESMMALCDECDDPTVPFDPDEGKYDEDDDWEAGDVIPDSVIARERDGGFPPEDWSEPIRR